MQISPSTAPRLPPAAAASAVPILDSIMRKSDMTGDPAIDFARGFGITLMLTDSDRALIEKATGVKMDPETGESSPPNVSPEACEFIHELASQRCVEYQTRQPSRPLDGASVRDLFRQAVEEGHPLDPNLMLKLLDVLSGAIDAKSGAKTNDKANDKTDVTSEPAPPAPQRIDRYA
jgi:hypothetical protein